ncbi:MAG: nuclear transport factor 2 family protein [Leptolyngbyaceae cyanobacterium RM2_2_21]|nr:nuclear transport factor 2 family protein [Leptolyngbyaceae cyanobacterium RM2_2_21]
MNSTVLTALSLLLTLVIGGHTVGMGWFPPEMTALASFSEKPIDRSLVTKPMSMALSSSAATDLVKRQAGGWENADVDQIVADFAEDCHFIVPGQQLQGRSQVYQAATEFFAAANQVNITIHRIIVQDRRSRWNGSGTK